ncbi:hypothetical protein SAMN02745179_00990 [Mycoplasmopsis agassizii]|nr:hypothetical protein SAMN02745179_00990 [Mycoplasmopsis agassizii]
MSKKLFNILNTTGLSSEHSEETMSLKTQTNNSGVAHAIN